MTDPFPKKLHRCWLTSAKDGYGAAVSDCVETESGKFWVGNGEYGSRVNFCPICGRKAPVQVPAGQFGTGT